MMAAPPDVMNHGTSGSTAPAQNAANDEVAAPAGDPSSSGSMPSSSRAWVRTASSSSAMTDSARARAAAGATPRDWYSWSSSAVSTWGLRRISMRSRVTSRSNSSDCTRIELYSPAALQNYEQRRVG